MSSRKAKRRQAQESTGTAGNRNVNKAEGTKSRTSTGPATVVVNEASSPAITPGTRLLPYHDVMMILALKIEPDERDTPQEKLWAQEWDEFRDEVREKYKKYGCVEMEEEYFVERKRTKACLEEAWNKIDFSGIEFADDFDESKFKLVFPGEEEDTTWADEVDRMYQV